MPRSLRMRDAAKPLLPRGARSSSALRALRTQRKCQNAPALGWETSAPQRHQVLRPPRLVCRSRPAMRRVVVAYRQLLLSTKPTRCAGFVLRHYAGRLVALGYSVLLLDSLTSLRQPLPADRGAPRLSECYWPGRCQRLAAAWPQWRHLVPPSSPAWPGALGVTGGRSSSAAGVGSLSRGAFRPGSAPESTCHATPGRFPFV